MFLLPTVEFLGHKISAQGLQPTNEKIRAINNAPAPINVSQLKSFLDSFNFHLSNILPCTDYCKITLSDNGKVSGKTFSRLSKCH